MNDRMFILNFLNKNFEVKINSNGVIFLDKRIKCPPMDSFTFTSFFRTIFTDFITDENERAFSICKEWFSGYKSHIVKDIDLYLSDVKIKLTRREWIAQKPDGTIITLEDVKNTFKDTFSSEFITQYYGDWFSTEVSIISERLMTEGYV